MTCGECRQSFRNKYWPEKLFGKDTVFCGVDKTLHFLFRKQSTCYFESMIAERDRLNAQKGEKDNEQTKTKTTLWNSRNNT